MSLLSGHRASGLFVGSLMLSFAFPCGLAAQDLPLECRIGGLALGPQAYSFNRFTFFEAIDKAKELGCSVIEGYPGQKLSPDDPTQFNHDAPPSVWAKAKVKLENTGVRLVAYGVVGLGSNEEANRRVFDFAKVMGISTITSEPSPATKETFDVIEKLVKEYNIKVAIHNHPKRANDPKYRYWDPEFVLELVDGRDPRIGSCADTGHWARSGVKPIAALKILEGRIISSHLKDLNEFGNPEAHDVHWGTGVCDVKAILDEFRRQHFSGMVSMEYEYNWENNVPDMLECVAFAREYGKSN